MKPSTLSMWHPLMLLCFQAIADANPILSRLLSRGHQHTQPDYELPGAWGSCGSKYGLEPADTTGAIECATMIAIGQGKTMSIGRDDKPRLLCDKYGAKVWISPYLNQGGIATEDTFTFKTIDVLNFTVQGALRCCDYKVSSTCSGWGMLTDTPGSNALISINHSDKPEPVSCNDSNSC
ncbi:hypothetical protein E0Z10_g8208 [Xylaria hypoxylon]|uniref:Ecp2 effector protein domain-containing protein n=1 Tax=Xylaria hypoxylon TaxID=37992 RepID=A0A4Z0YVY0_9PEZI|nr:hypothetical protein E0Z10_g8208 [Xylaria hypoxylon]